eukprot:4261184-Alexandrium_andersonii.AAC.1
MLALVNTPIAVVHRKDGVANPLHRRAPLMNVGCRVIDVNPAKQCVVKHPPRVRQVLLRRLGIDDVDVVERAHESDQELDLVVRQAALVVQAEHGPEQVQVIQRLGGAEVPLVHVAPLVDEEAPRDAHGCEGSHRPVGGERIAN